MRDDDLDRELRAHLDLEAEELRAAGSSPQEALHAARRTLGNTTLLKETIREMASWTSFERLFQDLRYGVRLLRRTPGFSAVAILTLGLGIGANTAIFSVVNAVLLRPLPFADSSRLMRIAPTVGSITNYPDFQDWKARSRSFEQMEAYVPRAFSITGGDRPVHVRGLRTSGGLLQLLQVNPIHGRTFVPDEIQPGRDHVVLLSEGLWQSSFAHDPGVLGKTVKLNDEVFTVIGILPSTFQFPPDQPAEIVLPQPPDPNRGHGFLNVVGRLKTNATLPQAQVEMETIGKQLELEYPKFDKGSGVRVLSLRDSYAASFRPALLIFLSAVGFVLLIACANVANLFLARTAGRQKELVVRAALGAGRFRLIRQLITESALLGLAGGVVGLLLAYWGAKGLVMLVGSTFSTQALDTVSIDTTVLAFTLLLSVVVGMVAGLAPALGASRLDVNDTLKEGSRGLTGNRRRNRIRGTLVVAEIALGPGAADRRRAHDQDFRAAQSRGCGSSHPENVLTLNLAIGGKKYAETQCACAVRHRDFASRGASSRRTVRLGGYRHSVDRDNDAIGFSIEGRPDPRAQYRRSSVNINVIGPGYLRTLGIPLLKGRDFTERDTEAAPLVALINQSMARKLLAQSGSHRRAHFRRRQELGDHSGRGGRRPARRIERGTGARGLHLLSCRIRSHGPILTMLVRTSSDPMKLAASDSERHLVR